MIEVRELDRRSTLVCAQSTLAEQTQLDARQLLLAAHWADLHHPDSLPPAETELEARRRRFDQDYGVQPGGDGTPQVLRSCFAELGTVLQTSAGGAKHLIGDALDLRHRLPRLWAEVQAGRVRAWKARKVAQATRHLSCSVMTQVDLGLVGLLTALPWSRFETVLDATVMRADPAGAEHAEAEAASRRFVSLGLDGGRGLKTLIARGAVLDILTFLAAVNRLADILEQEGDPDSVQVRRSKAAGSWASPTTPSGCSPGTSTTPTIRKRSRASLAALLPTPSPKPTSRSRRLTSRAGGHSIWGAPPPRRPGSRWRRCGFSCTCT